ncbi:MAG: 3-deoxy-7-phosphoheptulonate synthase, partial [Coxiellaceae bacterium]|nr:3-deoxy-7-phosphoheptulonate synthase [Coxiellaceae bacterium]
DPQAAIDYAKKLKTAIEEYKNTLCIVMRVYFEKPRTTVGWKGLINDPRLDNSFDINQGLRTARELLLEINNLGVPTGSEFLDTIIPQYISDLTSWAAIGARTTESQIHRELASGLSMPVGFKNGTMGSIDIAVDAICAAKEPHHFLGVSKQGIAAIVSTEGNSDCHIILRGSKTGTNYDAASIAETAKLIEARKLPARIMVDCSHGNSSKNYTKQKDVLNSLCGQKQQGNQSIFGLMIESNLVAGNQALIPNEPLIYGKSITDACVDWEETQAFLKKLNDTVLSTRNQ